MSACLLIRDKDNIFIGSDGAICYNNKNKNIRISNTGKKLFETDNYLFFCSGNYKYVKKTIQHIYESKPVELLNIQYFLKSMNIEKSEKYFNIEILLIEKKTLDVFQISEYNNFEIYKHEFPKKEEILVLSAGLKTDDLSNFAIKLISQSKDIKYIYKNVFNQISCNEVGGKMVVYKINKNLTSLFYEENIDNFYNVIKYNEENVHSVIANNIVGRMIAGNSLTITNDDGIVTKTFTLDQNGATITNGSLLIRNNISQILLDPAEGFKIQKNTGTISVPVWTNQMYIDTSGNAVFSGNLSAATGSFSGSITASSGYIGRWVIDANGIKDPSGNNSMYLFSDGSVNLQFAGLDVYRATPTAGTGTLSYGGEIFEVSTADTVSFGTNTSLSSDFYIWTNTFHMNGDAGVSGTFSGLTFVNGILVGA